MATKDRQRVSQDVRNLLKKQANYSCVLCNLRQTQWLKLEIHHLIPTSLGGTNDIDNLIAVCPNCHSKLHSNKYVRTR